MTERNTAGKPHLATRWTLALVAFCLAICCSNVRASIVAPAADSDIGVELGLPLTADQIDAALDKLAEADASMAAPSTKRTASQESRQSPTEDLRGPGRADLEHFATLSPDAGTTGGSTGGSNTSSSSSSAGAGSGAGLAPHAATTPLLADNAPVERYAAERSLFLPEAPGMELLRPPRG